MAASSAAATEDARLRAEAGLVPLAKAAITCDLVSASGCSFLHSRSHFGRWNSIRIGEVATLLSPPFPQFDCHPSSNVAWQQVSRIISEAMNDRKFKMRLPGMLLKALQVLMIIGIGNDAV